MRELEFGNSKFEFGSSDGRREKTEETPRFLIRVNRGLSYLSYPIR